jgi:hypothetical protein
MNRFLSRQPAHSNILRALLSLTVTVAVLMLFYFGVNSAMDGTIGEQRRTLEDAVYRNIIQCYITEGTYPEDLDYLEAHYPLMYDRDRFFIDYRPVGENIMPEVTIITRTS